VGKRGLTIARVFPSLHVKVEKSRKVEKVDLAPVHVKRGSRKKFWTVANLIGERLLLMLSAGKQSLRFMEHVD